MRRLALLLIVVGTAARAETGAVVSLQELARLAVVRSLTMPEAKVVITQLRPSVAAGCRIETAMAVAPPGEGGETMLRLAGETVVHTPCEGWANVRASITIAVLVTTRPLASGETIAGAVELAERPWSATPHPILDLPPGAVTTESLAAGTVVDARHVRTPGPGYGESINVVLQSGGMSVEESGRRTPCGGGVDCAILPSGRRVEGKIVSDQLVVAIP